jgi:hypothetical protein
MVSCAPRGDTVLLLPGSTRGPANTWAAMWTAGQTDSRPPGRPEGAGKLWCYWEAVLTGSAAPPGRFQRGVCLTEAPNLEWFTVAGGGVDGGWGAGLLLPLPHGVIAVCFTVFGSTASGGAVNVGGENRHSLS